MAVLEHLERELEYLASKFRQLELVHLDAAEDLRKKEPVDQARVELHKELAKVYGNLSWAFGQLAGEMAIDRYELERWAKGD